MVQPKYKRGWYVTQINTGIKGKIVDVYKTPRGIDYQILVSGTRNYYMTIAENQLIREGVQNGL